MNQDAYDIAGRLDQNFMDKFDIQAAWRSKVLEKNYAHKISQGMTPAQAQFYILTQMQAIKARSRGSRMGNFAERMRATIRERLGAFGGKAKPLSEAQFKAALDAY